MQNIKLIVAYDGTSYLGWQKTHSGPSIENELQQVLEQILQEKINLQAASRTDAGVHAHGQVVNFITSKEHLDLKRLIHSINSLLPRDIVVRDIVKMYSEFHPTLNCIGKEYHYMICNGSVQLPQYRAFSWHHPFSLKLSDMRAATQHLVGTKDFSALCNFQKNVSYNDYIRTISDIQIHELPDSRLQITVKGHNFLYKMVRNIAGLLVYAGAGRIGIETLPIILSSSDRTLAGITAPAHGLFLHEVFY